MQRRDFLRQCARWAAAAPLASLAASLPAGSLLAAGSLLGCGTGPGYGTGEYDFDVNFDGRVLVIGAGAAGLAAGYMLGRHGIEYTVLEASDRFGGRVKRDRTLAGFPIDLGAEWIHDHPSVLASLIDDPGLDATLDVVPFAPQDISYRTDGGVRAFNVARNFMVDYKFRRTTWYGFLERFIAPTVQPHIRFGQPVTAIDTRGSGVRVATDDGTTYEADRVILTVPIQILQERQIEFTPPLDATRTDAIDSVWIPHGIKVFSRFDARFYPDVLLNGDPLDDASTDKLYYDATLGKGVSEHVLALFWVADEAAAFTELGSDDAIVSAVLADLDGLFGGRASRHHIASVAQNWSADPYIRGAYSSDFAGGYDAFMAALADPFAERVFFAGEAFGGTESSTVHGAMQSAYAAVERLLAG